MIASLLTAALVLGLDDPESGFTFSTAPEQPLARASFEIAIGYTVPTVPLPRDEPLVGAIENGDIILDSRIVPTQANINPPLAVEDRFVIPPLRAGTYTVHYFRNRERSSLQLTGTITVAGGVPLNVTAPLCIALLATGVIALYFRRRRV